MTSVLSAGKDVFNLNNGYSFAWFIVLYLLGAFFRIYGRRDKSLFWFGIYIVSALMMLFSRNILMILTERFPHEQHGGILYVYTSPLVIVEAIAFFMFFISIEFTHYRLGKVLRKLASATFGVYLLHDNKIVRTSIIENSLEHLMDKNLFKALLLLMVYSFLLYVLCSSIEFIRQYVFRKLKIDDKIKYVVRIVSEIIQKKIYETIDQKITHHM